MFNLQTFEGAETDTCVGDDSQHRWSESFIEGFRSFSAPHFDKHLLIKIWELIYKFVCTFLSYVTTLTWTIEPYISR